MRVAIRRDRPMRVEEFGRRVVAANVQKFGNLAVNPLKHDDILGRCEARPIIAKKIERRKLEKLRFGLNFCWRFGLQTRQFKARCQTSWRVFFFVQLNDAYEFW